MPGRAQWRLVVLAVVVFGSVTAGTLQLKHVGERGVQAERDLQGATTELHAQDALEWRVISGRVRPQDVLEDLEASRQRARQLTTAATGGDAEVEEEVLTLLDAYSSAVDEELRLLAAGREVAAEEYDEAHVDPAFEAALEDLEDHGAEVSALAARARATSDAGVVLTVALSLAVTALVQSRRRRAEARRTAERRSEARYRSLVDQSEDLVVVTDRSGRARYLSPSAERLFDLPADSGPLDLAQVVHPEDAAALAAVVAPAQALVEEGSAPPVEVRFTGPRGWRVFEVSGRDLSANPAVGGVVVTGHDVTDRRALQQEMEHRALHDHLTGLPNRALLADRFDQALRSAQREGRSVGLLLIDLDRFKEINDTLGHHVGDQLLTQIGPRLAGALRGSDTVARLGGDEFAVLLPGLHAVEDAVRVAGELQEALQRSFPVEGVDLDVEASIGVVLSGIHGADAGTLMQRADVAMYLAKQGHLGVCTYDAASDSHDPQRLALLGDLRRALEGEELFLVYQPKVALSTGEVCGAEALVRWDHPHRGLVLPDAFIPLAENTGLITPLTRRVLDLALAQARRWSDDGHPLQVAVNLSARNLVDDHLDALVGELLTAHGVPASLLKLEVTETAIMTDPVRAKDVLERLHALGVAISIDDFGAGYTSLAHLRDLPVTELKVDRSFVGTMDSDTSNDLIVRSVIELGHNLGLSAVAEGVEDAATLTTLSGYSCDVAQGYHLSRPLLAGAFDQWRAGWPGLPVVHSAGITGSSATEVARDLPSTAPAPAL